MSEGTTRGSSSPVSLLKMVILDHVSQECVQTSFEYLQWGRLHNLPGQSVLVHGHLHSKKDLPPTQVELPVQTSFCLLLVGDTTSDGFQLNLVPLIITLWDVSLCQCSAHFTLCSSWVYWWGYCGRHSLNPCWSPGRQYGLLCPHLSRQFCHCRRQSGWQAGFTRSESMVVAPDHILVCQLSQHS